MLDEQRSHSEIGASSYSRWSTLHGGCPGSVRLSRGMQTVESEYAKEGTHAHTVASQILEKHFYKKDPPGGWLAATDEMMEAVNVYVDYVKKEGARVLSERFIEHGFDLSEIYPGAYGTADAVIYHPQDKELVVIDYKHGAGISVEVEDNLQLQYYGLGALLSLKKPCKTVKLVVVQPRCDHDEGVIRSWTFDAVDILDFAADLAYDAAQTAKEDAPLVPSKHACKFCPAAVKCPAIKDKAQALAKLEFSATKPYDGEQLSHALQMLPALEAWCKKVRAFAYAEAVHGRTPPGWKMVAKRGTRKWNAPVDVIVDYMSRATLKPVKEFFTEPELKTPAQMEKLASKQINMGLREMIITVSSGYNLVPQSDTRPEVKLDPASEFAKIEGGDDGSE